MIKGFKDFVLRGNVVDLAVAVVIGAAFGAVVTQFTNSFIKPLIKLVGGGGLKGGTFTINKVVFDWAGFVNAIINFLIIAVAVYFFVVVPVNALMERRRRGQEPEPAAPSEDIVLLQEIRDLLRQRAV